MPLRLTVVAKTDKGLVRTGNEDYLHLDHENRVYAVCDGMGGHQAGEVASMTASETMRTAFTEFYTGILDDPELKINRPLPASGDLLLKSIHLANRAVYRKALLDQSLAGMGTTVVAVAFESDLLSIAHVGDSRAYRLGQKALEPLTIDHSWVAEVAASQNLSREQAGTLVGKNIILRALGVRESVEVDYRLVKVQAADIFILCSDGLCGYVDDDDIFNVASRSRDNPERMADDLIRMANDRGGADNVSVVVTEVKEVTASSLPEMDVFTHDAESADALNAEDRWLDLFVARHSEMAEQASESKERSRGSKALLVGIFVVFAVVALVIIYFSASR